MSTLHTAFSIVSILFFKKLITSLKNSDYKHREWYQYDKVNVAPNKKEICNEYNKKRT